MNYKLPNVEKSRDLPKANRIGRLWAVRLNGPHSNAWHESGQQRVFLSAGGRHHTMQLRQSETRGDACCLNSAGLRLVVQPLTLSNRFPGKWASCSCWSPSSCATSSSATFSWSAASLLTCCSSAHCPCGCSISSWPARSTSDWATASVVVSGNAATFTTWCSVLYWQGREKTWNEKQFEAEPTFRELKLIPPGYSDTAQAFLFVSIKVGTHTQAKQCCLLMSILHTL